MASPSMVCAGTRYKQWTTQFEEDDDDVDDSFEVVVVVVLCSVVWVGCSSRIDGVVYEMRRFWGGKGRE